MEQKVGWWSRESEWGCRGCRIRARDIPEQQASVLLCVSEARSPGLSALIWRPGNECA